MESSDSEATAVQSYRASRDYVGKTPKHIWTAAFILLTFGFSLMPALGIAAYGGLIPEWAFSIFVVAIFNALLGNMADVEVKKRKAAYDQWLIERGE